MRKEFEELKQKLKSCLEKIKEKEYNEEEVHREEEVKDISNRIEYYKRQIQAAKYQLTNGFNIDKYHIE